MTIRTRITQVSRQRGFNAAEVARRLKMYPSNLSASDAGRRFLSLRALARVAKLLNCSLGDLLEVTPQPFPRPFPQEKLNRLVMEKDLGSPDGLERGWLHHTMLAWQRHYNPKRRRSR